MNTKRVVGVAVGLAVLAALGVFVLQRGKAPQAVVAPSSVPAASPAPPVDCLLPGPPPVAPNGAVASSADMKLGHDVMQNFVLQLEAYQACRNAQADHAAAGVSQAQKDQWVDLGNQAIDEANGLAASFGAQLKAFKARNPGK